MKLPNVEFGLIEESKITAYLLSEENSGGKSVFFAAFGFTIDAPEILRDALFIHAKTHEVTRVSETPHGIKYIVEGKIKAPDGRTPLVRSVWIVDVGREVPRLVTAYPLEGQNT